MHQSLQEGIAAQNAGNIPEARNIYGYILRHQPRHPDANHNMGLIAVTAGLPHQALPFFKTATEANPNIGQFWISYVDTLIKCNKTKVAKTALKKAKTYSSITTQVKKFDVFYDAEDYHQDYERLHPDQGYIQSVSVPRLNKFKKKMPEVLKSSGKH